MPPQIRIELVMIALASFSSFGATTHRNDLTLDKAEVVETIRIFFGGLESEDAAKFGSVIEPQFNTFDAGSRFSGQAIMTLMKTQHAAGKHYQCRVTEPDVHVEDETAWLAYVNKGSGTGFSGTTQQQWLESAVLKNDGASWKIVFLHSTRVPNSTKGASYK